MDCRVTQRLGLIPLFSTADSGQGVPQLLTGIHPCDPIIPQAPSRSVLGGQIASL